MVTKKIACSITGQKIKFEGEFITNVTLNEETLKLRLFLMKIQIIILEQTGWSSLNYGTVQSVHFSKKE